MESPGIPTDVDSAWYRRSVGVALAGLRDRKELTQQQAARELRWSLSKISRAENEAHALSVTDVEALLHLYEASATERKSILGEACRALEPSWWHEFRDIASPEFRRLLSYERSATALRAYHPSLVPGVLQTEGYATSLISMWIDDPDLLSRHVKLRMARKHSIYRDSLHEATFLIAEAALHHRIGGRDVMRVQIEALRTMALGRGPRLGVIPFANPVFPAMLMGFDLITLPPRRETALFLETPHESRTARDEAHLISRYDGYFTELRKRALFAGEAVVLLDRVLEATDADS